MIKWFKSLDKPDRESVIIIIAGLFLTLFIVLAMINRDAEVNEYMDKHCVESGVYKDNWGNLQPVFECK